MPNNVYRDLPVEGLYQLMVAAVKEMLITHDNNLDNGVAYQVKRQQVDLLLSEIDKRSVEKMEMDNKQ